MRGEFKVTYSKVIEEIEKYSTADSIEKIYYQRELVSNATKVT